MVNVYDPKPFAGVAPPAVTGAKRRSSIGCAF
jgi:hypothetical protein